MKPSFKKIFILFDNIIKIKIELNERKPKKSLDETKDKYFHNSKFNLFLSPSQIPNSGLGVYTKVTIPPNTLIDEYYGDTYSTCIGSFYTLELEPVKYDIDPITKLSKKSRIRLLY